jgi:hypothetical protein
VEGLSARLLTYPGPRPSVSLAFELANDGAEAWSGRIIEPVVPWDLVARVDGRQVKVRQPMLDLPSRARSLNLAPGERLQLPCPIVLVFTERPDDRFIWSLDTPPAAVELQATLNLGTATVPAHGNAAV